MRVLYLSEVSLPNNTAYTRRILALLRGISLNNCNCTIAVYDSKMQGVSTQNYFKVVIQNFGIRILSKFLSNHIAVKIDSLISLVQLCSRLNQKYDVLLFSTENLLSCFIIVTSAKINDIPTIYLKSELPEVFHSNKFWLSGFYKMISMLDGVIVITEKLRMHFSKRTRVNCVKIGMAVEEDLHNFKLSVPAFPTSDPYIFFMGAVSNNKDGFLHVLDMFDNISDDFPNLRLMVVSTSGAIKVSSMKVADNSKIDFKLEVPHKELMGLINNAIITCLPRPNSVQNDFGFPTKLGEYLLAVPPLIVSSTSEIASFVSHLHDCYLFEPGDQKAFENGVRKLLDDSKLRKELSTNAKLTVVENFSFRKQGQLLHNFLVSLKRENGYE